MIDLRSDTVTRPTEPMLAAMGRADVGDDVYGEDPTVRELEERVAGLFGHEAALYCVTGSLANVLAVRAVVPVGAEILCESRAHIVRAELGAHAAMSGVTTRTWTEVSGYADPAVVEPMIAPEVSPYIVPTRAISVEQSHNFCGGTVQPLETLQSVRGLADAYGLQVHMDGARIWNAHVATGVPLATYGGIADVLAVCLSKGLGAPIGSLVLGSTEVIAESRTWRKRLGAGWRQAGGLAAAGLYALDHHIDRLHEDHAHARVLAEAVGVDPATVPTNMVMVDVDDVAAAVAAAHEAGVLIGAVGPRTVRLVTHLGVERDDIDRAAKALAGVFA